MWNTLCELIMFTKSTEAVLPKWRLNWRSEMQHGCAKAEKRYPKTASRTSGKLWVSCSRLFNY